MITYSESQKSLDVAFSFVADFLTYSLERMGLDWEMPKSQKFKRLRQRLIFASDECLVSPHLIMEYGDASVKLRRDMKSKFQAEVINHGSFLFYEVRDFQDFVRSFAKKNFDGKQPWKKFFHYCAFMIEVAIYCIKQDRPDYVSLLVWEIEDVLKNHMKMRKIKDFSLDALIEYILNRYGEVEMDTS